MVWGVIAGLGPGMQARRESDEKIASSKSKRTIAEAVESRNAKRFEWWERGGNLIGNRPGVSTPAEYYQMGRNAVDNPQLWQQWQGTATGINTGMMSPAIPQPSPFQTGPTVTPPTDLATGVPGGEEAVPTTDLGGGYTGQADEGGFVPTSGNYQHAYAEGGYVQLPGAQDGGAISVGAPAQAQPVAPPQQSANIPSRRERYNEWYGEMSRMAFLNGGMDGLQQFKDMEDATSRQQALGFANQAATAMNEGMVGDAMRLGNSALESLSFDSGLEFVAQDGSLHLKGKDGSLSEKLTTQDLMGFTDQYMMTPEKYLDWKTQEEVERSNRATERLRGREASVSERRMTLDESLEPRQTAAQEAQALAALRNSDANLARAIDRAGAYGWDEENILRINQNVHDWSLKQFDGLSGDLTDYYGQGQAFADLKSGVTQIILSNPWDAETQQGYVDPDLAATVYQLVTAPAGMDLGGADKDFTLGTHPDAPGAIIASYKGQRVVLPPMLLGDAMERDPQLRERLEQQKTGGAVPTSQAQDPDDPSGWWNQPGVQGVLDEFESEQRTREMLQAQEDERHRAATHS